MSQPNSNHAYAPLGVTARYYVADDGNRCLEIAAPSDVVGFLRFKRLGTLVASLKLVAPAFHVAFTDDTTLQVADIQCMGLTFQGSCHLAAYRSNSVVLLAEPNTRLHWTNASVYARIASFGIESQTRISRSFALRATEILSFEGHLTLDADCTEAQLCAPDIFFNPTALFAVNRNSNVVIDSVNLLIEKGAKCTFSGEAPEIKFCHQDCLQVKGTIEASNGYVIFEDVARLDINGIMKCKCLVIRDSSPDAKPESTDAPIVRSCNLSMPFD